jgi:AcrR family transcriptional regulator
MEKDLDKNDWLKAARLALLKGGVDAVRVEPLARDLHVTKGSFYWHFKDRDALLDLLLSEWENEMAEMIAGLKPGEPVMETLLTFVHRLMQRARLSEAGDVPSDAAIFAWASVSPGVAERVNKAEKERIRLLTRISDQPGLMELFYLAWLGFVARGQRVPQSRKNFPDIARLMLSLLEPAKSNGAVAKKRRAAARARRIGRA